MQEVRCSILYNNDPHPTHIHKLVKIGFDFEYLANDGHRAHRLSLLARLHGHHRSSVAITSGVCLISQLFGECRREIAVGVLKKIITIQFRDR